MYPVFYVSYETGLKNSLFRGTNSPLAHANKHGVILIDPADNKNS